MRNALILAEAGPDFGVGHLRRSLVLAEALAARGCAVRFALTTDHCLDMVQGFPAKLADATTPPDDLFVADGYRIPAARIAPWAERARLTALIDDLADRPRPADIVVNAMLYAEACDYSAYPARTRLLGPRYALVRPAFAALRMDNARTRPRALVSFGGGRAGLLGIAVARALAQIWDGPIDQALGPAAAGDAAPALPASVTLHRGADLADLMRPATLFVGGLGTSFLEALAAGLPIVSAQVADDQWRVAEAARTLDIPVLDAADPAAIAKAAAHALQGGAKPVLPEFPDGRGADRLAEALLSF